MTELALHDGDEFLVVASDGLWDVLDSPDVVKLARRDLARGAHPQVRRGGGTVGAHRHGSSSWAGGQAPQRRRRPAPPNAPPVTPRTAHTAPPSPPGRAAQEVAEKLSALAVKRGSQDNVGVVVVDLGRTDWSAAGNGGGNGLFGGLTSIFGSR